MAEGPAGSPNMAVVTTGGVPHTGSQDHAPEPVPIWGCSREGALTLEPSHPPGEAEPSRGLRTLGVGKSLACRQAGLVAIWGACHSAPRSTQGKASQRAALGGWGGGPGGSSQRGGGRSGGTGGTQSLTLPDPQQQGGLSLGRMCPDTWGGLWGCRGAARGPRGVP